MGSVFVDSSREGIGSDIKSGAVSVGVIEAGGDGVSEGVLLNG